MKKAALAAEAGGYLVYSPTADKNDVVTALNNKSKNAAVDADTAGFVKFTASAAGTDGATTVAQDIGQKGYYIFARKQVATNGSVEYTYDGYYYDGSSNYYKIKVDTAGDKITTYGNNGSAIKVTPVLFTKTTETHSTADDVEATYDGTNNVLTYTFKGANAASTDDDIIVNIGLTNLGADDDQWTAVDKTPVDNKLTTWYYNNALYGGESTSNLVDYVELDENVKNEAYYDLDFYLNVHVESIQAMEGADKADTSVSGGWAASDKTKSNGATGTTSSTNKTLNGTTKDVKIGWTYNAS